MNCKKENGIPAAAGGVDPGKLPYQKENENVRKALYQGVSALRRQCGISFADYPLSVPMLCQKQLGIPVGYLPLRTPGLKGMASFGGGCGYAGDVILINSRQGLRERNFICAHELMHLTFHRREPGYSFTCYEAPPSGKSAYLEWQANEGAAELLVPARLLLPIIGQAFGGLRDWRDFERFKQDTASRFGVAPTVISYRYESLRFEISQYLSGVPLHHIQLLTRRQKARLPTPASLNDLQHRLFLREQNHNETRKLNWRMLAVTP
ncbi:MAG TPA: ImmA/IrrE family metallo-endopeptidase [Candidatus Gallacutalibacter stercoravium]|nr:ImmA/IrrE family metallo-endopeptidase [Candidatus Gallacutalibacter stercoravium]